MARAHNVYVVTLNARIIAAFTVRHECISWLSHQWPKLPTNLRVVKVRDGDWQAEPKDITATLYGLAD